MRGIPIDQVLTKFNLEGELIRNLESMTEPPVLRIKLGEDQYIDFDITDVDKKTFSHPEPVEPEPIRPLLSDEEREDIKNIHE
jgi:hypothetical protein